MPNKLGDLFWLCDLLRDWDSSWPLSNKKHHWCVTVSVHQQVRQVPRIHNTWCIMTTWWIQQACFKYGLSIMCQVYEGYQSSDRSSHGRRCIVAGCGVSKRDFTLQRHVLCYYIVIWWRNPSWVKFVLTGTHWKYAACTWQEQEHSIICHQCAHESSRILPSSMLSLSASIVLGLFKGWPSTNLWRQRFQWQWPNL